METFVLEMLNLQDWMRQLGDAVAPYLPFIRQLTERLVLLGLVIGGIRIVIVGGGDLRPMLMRVLLAAVMLGSSSFINVLVYQVWQNLRVFASANIADGFEQVHNDVRGIAISAEYIMWGSAVLGSDTGNTAVSRGGVSGPVNDQMHARINTFSGIMSVALLVIGMVMFLFLVLTGVAITIAGLLLPVACGLIVFPNWGARMIGAYARMVVSSLLIVLLFPIVFQVMFYFLAVRPITYMTTSLQENQTELQLLTNDVNNENRNALERLEGLERQIAAKQEEINAIEQNDSNRKQVPNLFGVPLFEFRTSLPFTDAAQANLDRLNGEKRALEQQRDEIRLNWLERIGQRLELQARDLANELRTAIVMLCILAIGIFTSIVILVRLEGYIGTLVGGFAVGAAAAVIGAGVVATRGATRAVGSAAGRALSSPPDARALGNSTGHKAAHVHRTARAYSQSSSQSSSSTSSGQKTP